MENQNRLKMRISRMFRSSFGSCRTRNLTDVMEKPGFNPPENLHSFHFIDPPSSSPKNRAFSSVFRSETFDHRRAVSAKDSSTRRNKISECSSPFLWGVIRNGNAINNLDGRSCPPVSPNTPLNHELGKTKEKNVRSKKKKKKKKHAQKKNRAREFFPFNSCAKDTDFGGYWWYSSDEDDETDTLFSSRSLSSDSSRSRRRRRKNDRSSSDMGVLPLQGKVKDTFAVVKRSSDPHRHSDFRTSMVEMIVEKQIFSPADLENLLQCFLSLNSNHHHQIIVEVFTEIWEALFSEWGI